MSGPSGPTGKESTGRGNRSSGGQRPELRYLAIGRVIRAHGLRGELSVAVLTDFPERFDTTEWVYLGDEQEAAAYRLESYRWHNKHILLTLAGVIDRTQAEQLRGQWVQVPIEEATPLPDGSYYSFQLLGLEVVTTANQVLGTLTNVLETGANDVYVVETDNQELLLPAIPDVVKAIDLEKGQIVVEVIEGLI
jgi:16S rRNA processing protein RimM